jgi:histidyl-tRNA synthetase
MVFTASVSDLFDYVAGHLSIIGWPVLIGVVWRFRGVLDEYFQVQKDAVDKVSKTLESVEQAKAIAVEAVKTATESGTKKAQELMARVDANQERIESAAAAIQKIDQNDLAHLTEGLNKKWQEQGEATRDMLIVLNSIDSNIKILADRSRRSRNGR